MPQGMIAFFRALYTDNQVYLNIDGDIIWLYKVFAGVLQGCPLSGSLSVIVMNPCLNALNANLGKNDICRAFADDIANVIESHRTLPKVAKVFDAIRHASNLGLKIKKCVIIPLGGPFSDALKQKIKHFLTEHLPQWASVRIQDSGEYLGFQIGTSIKDKLWRKPEAKWDTRARSIAAAKLAPSIGVQQYNMRAVTTMGYVAQLHPLPASSTKSEKSVVQRIFHVMNNTFPVPLYFRMKDIRAPQPTSLQALSYATRYRTATKTITTWQQNFVQLNKCRSDFAPLDWLAGRAHSPPWWDTPPIIDLVADAANGFNNKFGPLSKDVNKLCECRPIDSAGRVLASSSSRTLPSRLTEAHQSWTAEASQPLGSERNDRVGIQSAAIKIILPQLYSFDFGAELGRRLRLWVPAIRSLEDLGWRIESTLAATNSAKMKPFFIIALITTWCNGWTTSYRTGSPKRSCIYGCDAADSLLHYMACPVVWGSLRNVGGVPADTPEYTVLQNLGLDHGAHGLGTIPSKVFQLAIVTDVYNNLKNLNAPAAATVKEQFEFSYKKLVVL